MSKTIIIALDSATWDIILPMVKEDKLPFFKRLLQEHSTFNCNSTIPPYTPVAWTSAFTNLTPAQHGIYDFRTLAHNTISLTSTSHIRKKYIWHHLSTAGRKVIVYNIPMTYPAWPVNGAMISSFTATTTDNDFFYPRQLKKDFLREFPDYHITAPGEYRPKKDNSTYAASLLDTLKQKTRASDWLLDRFDWEVAFLGILEIDHLQHFFYDQLNAKNSPIQKGYIIIDKWLEKLHNTLKCQLFIVSDHGAQEAKSTIFLNKWLEENGYLYYKNRISTKIKKALRSSVLRPTPLETISYITKTKGILSKANQNNRNTIIRKVFLDLDDVDMHQTKAFSFGEYGGIFLLDKNPHIKKEILNNLKRSFINRDVNIINTKELYEDSIPPTIPDIQVIVDNAATTSSSVYAFAGHKIFDPHFSKKTGQHAPVGIAALTDSQGRRLHKSSLYDIFPTITNLANIKPLHNRGSSLTHNIVRGVRI